MPSDLTLYTNPMSRGRIARWMLEETGAPYDVQVLTFGGSVKSADYLAVNPMGKVPALRHGDVVVTETAAICAYLADAFPDMGLAPPLAERGAYYRWLFFAAGPFEAATFNKVLGLEAVGDQEGMIGYGNLATVLDTLAGVLANSPYVAGERFSAADVYLGANLDFDINVTKVIDARPVFVDYLARLNSREARVRAIALDGALIEAQSAPT